YLTKAVIEHVLIRKMTISHQPQAATGIEAVCSSDNETLADVGTICTALCMKGWIADDHVIAAQQSLRDVMPVILDGDTLGFVLQVELCQIECTCFCFVQIKRRDAGTAVEQFNRQITKARAKICCTTLQVLGQVLCEQCRCRIDTIPREHAGP